MLTAFIFVCSLSGPCDRASAVDVIVTPVRSAIPTTCLFEGMAQLARTRLADDTVRAVVRCER
jgi:hypothetical protein